MFDGFLPASKVKKQKLRNPSQSETEFGVCQPAVAEVSYEPASKVSFKVARLDFLGLIPPQFEH